MVDHGRAQSCDRPAPKACNRAGQAAGGGADGRAPGLTGRPAAADLHLLPPGAADREPGGADAADGGRAEHRGDRPGVPGGRGDDVAASAPGQGQDRARRHPLPGARAGAAGGADRWRARGALPRLQRGVRPAGGRPRGGGAAAVPAAGGPDAHGGRGARPARARAAPAGPPRHPFRRERRPGADGGAGPVPVGRGDGGRGLSGTSVARHRRDGRRARTGCRQRSRRATRRRSTPRRRTGPGSSRCTTHWPWRSPRP